MARRKAERAEEEEALAKKKADEQAKQDSVRAKVGDEATPRACPSVPRYASYAVLLLALATNFLVSVTSPWQQRYVSMFPYLFFST